MTIDAPDWLTVRRAAEILGLHPATLRRYACAAEGGAKTGLMFRRVGVGTGRIFVRIPATALRRKKE